MSDAAAVELSRPNTPTVTSTNYASMAEDLMRSYAPESGKLTTTKLRGIYALIMNVSAKINVPEDYEPHRPDIQYLKVRMAYEAGRESSVKTFLQKTHLMDLVDAVNGFDQFKLYCRYAEALVAYFRFFGGKEA